ncbi:unnamed protein product [Lactuca saligna]|uniref:Cytochrome P450 n=1 Tax=Lactuca saligna TaxID=75948 RepID=A0AA35Z354_LACSI|nr:unnamed protein product [Lactuca saligna]
MSTMEIYLITSIALATVIFFLFKFIATRKTPKRNLPPEPWGLPIIGHMHHLNGTLSHRGITNLARKYSTFLHLRFGEVSTIVVSPPKLATDIIFSPYGEYWRQLRRLCTMELLSAKKVKSFPSLREEESWMCLELVRTLLNGKEKIQEEDIQDLSYLNQVIKETLRDPEYWNDPESFIPERFENNPTNILGEDYEYLPFGAGRRM